MTIDTAKIAQDIERFNQVLSPERLKSLAREHGADDQRERRLTLVPFFWIMILIHSYWLHFGGLGQAVSLFCVVSATVLGQAVSLTRMAISKQIKRRSWPFFQAVLSHLTAQYPDQVPSLVARLEPRLKDWRLVDSTVLDLARRLRRHFKSTVKGKAQLKLHIVSSAGSGLLQQVHTTAQKCNDKAVKFVNKTKALLYIFDLGYWAYPLLDAIIERESFFVSRRRSDCDPLIVAAEKKSWVGKTVSEVLEKIRGQEFECTVKLAKWRANPMKHEVRLVGCKDHGRWHLYVTNLTASVFRPRCIAQIYASRWQIELLFNQLKPVINLDHLFSRTVQGIQVEIFVALIYYTMTRLVMALAAKQTATPIEQFSFIRSFRIVRELLNHSLSVLDKTKPWDITATITTMVALVILNGRKDKYYIQHHIAKLAWGT